MSGFWPDNTQCAVMLTFDLDGVSAILNRDPNVVNHASVMSRHEFGFRLSRNILSIPLSLMAFQNM